MDIFLALLSKIIPLYALILMGFIGGKYLHCHRDTIANILFYMLAPLIIFSGVLNTRLDANVLILPLITYLVSSFLCITFYQLSKLVWQDPTKNLMAISAGSGNTGYFGLPIVLLLMDNQGEGVYIMAMLGIALYESSIGFYILAKGTYSSSESVKKLFKLPSLYAFALGATLNGLGVESPAVFGELVCYLKGAFTVLGMMLIGLGLASVHHLKMDYKFIGMTFLAKFVVWPLIALTIIFCDATWLHFLNNTIYSALFILSIVPLAANTVALAAIIKNQPEKSATAVFLSTLFAIVYVPFMTTYFIDKIQSPDLEIALPPPK